MSSSNLANLSNVGLTNASRQKLLHAVFGLYDPHAAHESNPNQKPEDIVYHAEDKEAFFAPNITFRDPLMQVTGLNDYKAQFASLHRAFKDIKLEVLSVTHGHGRPMISGRLDKREAVEMIFIDGNCTYEVNRFLKITIRQMTQLGLNADGLIETHEDIWSYASLVESIPIIGRLYKMAQPIVGHLFSSAINQWFGFRAGVRPKEARFKTNTLHSTYHPIESQRYGNPNRSEEGQHPSLVDSLRQKGANAIDSIRHTTGIDQKRSGKKKRGEYKSQEHNQEELKMH